MILRGKSKQDRRRGRRQILNTSVQVFTESDRVDALGINLSDVGMCLFAIADLPLGTQVQIEFLPPRSLERVRVCGTVRHRAVYLYGIEFLVDSDQRPDSGPSVSTITGRQPSVL
jgi:threonine/homoserine efflux transporter RhtA